MYVRACVYLAPSGIVRNELGQIRICELKNAKMTDILTCVCDSAEQTNGSCVEFVSQDSARQLHCCQHH